MPLNPEIGSRDNTRLVEKLLGRAPRVPYRVLCHCPDTTPQVLEADPIFLEDGLWKPFPTFLWLVCPRLRRALAQLEENRFTRLFARRLSEDAAFSRQFDEGQRTMIAYRLERAEELFQGPLPAPINRVLAQTTIAGSRCYDGVKCLHAHVAQELAWGNNPIGGAALEQVGRCSAEIPCLTGRDSGGLE